ncbi:MAG: aminopeptidase [Actinomycetota bacterium]|nr:aminopeptidase [Actinomycetota bacterium]
MRDPRVERLADVLVSYSTRVAPGDLVLIEGSSLAAPLVRAVYRRVLEAGGHPRVRVAIEGVTEHLLTRGTDSQLEWLNPARVEEFERADVRMAFDSEFNTRALTGVDPARQAIAARARERLLNLQLERAAAGDLRWVVTLFPTTASAQEAEMSLPQYEDFVFGAGLLDHDDPLAAWRAFGERLTDLGRWLESKHELRIVSDGTDLTIGVGGRRWIPCDGKENFPDGEVFTGPVEVRVDGTIAFTFPAVFQGREVEGIRLRFQEGEVVEAYARRGQEFLDQMLSLDEGARRAGEFAFGMNDSIQTFTRNTLFDEKIGGTVHLALGKSYPETGATNQSALHWDLVCDLRAGGEVYADGGLVYRDGRFLDDVS